MVVMIMMFLHYIYLYLQVMFLLLIHEFALNKIILVCRYPKIKQHRNEMFKTTWDNRIV